MSKKTIYIWCCDINNNSGEGILANKFIRDLKYYNKNIKILVNYPKNKIGNIFFERFLYPFQGLLKLWFIYIFKNNYKICYLNYLPLWNFFLFMLLPPKTILGPITGGSLFLNKPFLNFFFRKYFLNVFFYLGTFFLYLRWEKLLFSTDFLQSKNLKHKNYSFNYVLQNIKKTKFKFKKKYDLIFYLRKHNNKNTDLQVKIAKELSKKFKILTVGEKINDKNVKNLGFIERSKLLKYIRKTKFSFLSPENLCSLFAIDYINSKTNIFFQNNSKYKNKYLKGVIYLNYSNTYNLIKNIEKNLIKVNFFKIKINLKKLNTKSYFKL